MKSTRILSLLLAGMIASFSGLGHAQNAGKSREEVKMSRDDFLKIMHWDEAMSQWVLKSGMKPPAGVFSREEIITMRDMFLTMNVWNEGKSQFIPTKAPRAMASLPREQIEMETGRFYMMYKWSEEKSNWVPR